MPRQPTLFVVISIGIIIGVAFGSYFYLQALAEENVRRTLLEQQKQRQQDNTEALARHIGSDLHSITLTVELLAASPLLQSGELTGQQTKRLLEETLVEINEVTTVDTLFLLDRENIAVNVANDKYLPYVGLDLSDREYVREVTSSLRPHVTDSFMGAAGVQSFVIAVPIINSVTGEYVGLIGGDAPAIDFFRHYGNVDDLDSNQLILAVDRDGDFMAAGLIGVEGQNIFGEERQRAINANSQINAMYREVIAGNPSSAVFDTARGGERLATAHPVYFRGEQVMSVVLSTPTSVIYSQVGGVLAVSTLEIFALLAAVSAAVAVLFILLIRWNKSLDTKVKERTAELKESNEHLEQANAVLSEYNVQLGNAYEQVVKVNEQLEVNDKLQREFINIAAHELRTPVQPLLGVAEMIATSAKDADKIEVTRPELEMIIRNAKRLERLASDILEVSRIGTGSLSLYKEAVDLNQEITDVVSDAKSFLRPDKEVKIIVELSEDPIILEADKPRLFEVMSNLVNNAIKFTNSGTITVKAEKQGDYAVVSVKDSGSGIDPETMPRLFTRFFSKSETGTGLGLYIAKGIVEAHGGKIWGENNSDGSGATFAFTLPLRPSQELKSH